MTMEQVLSAFGEPGGQIGEQRRQCIYRYLAPLGLLTAEREGYVGFEVQFDRGQVVGWRTFRGLPSYEPMHVPHELKLWGKICLILFVVIVVWGGVKGARWSMAENASLMKSFNEREIDPVQLPLEFRFISHDTTLQGVIDRLGEPTRLHAMPVNPKRIKGSRLIMSSNAAPAIAVAEYVLPNKRTVIVVPEFPFERENRIRTVYYGQLLPDLDTLC